MRLMFHKKELHGHWFRDGEDTAGYTEKRPPYANYVFDDGLGDWVQAETADEAEGGEGG